MKKDGFRKALYLGSAMALITSSVPILPGFGENAMAESMPACTETAETTINSILRTGGESVKICLSDDTTDDVWIGYVANQKVILDLAGHTLTGKITVKNGAELTIYGGTFVSTGVSGISVAADSALNITGGIYKTSGDRTISTAGGQITISGGVFEAQRRGIIGVVNPGATGNINIAGGKFYGIITCAENSGTSAGLLLISGGDFTGTTGVALNTRQTKETIQIKGGTFGSIMAAGNAGLKFLADGYDAYSVNGVYEIHEVPTKSNVIIPTTVELKEGQIYNFNDTVEYIGTVLAGLNYYSRNQAVASINFNGINNESTAGMLATGIGETSVRVTSKWANCMSVATGACEDVQVKVTSGLKDITTSVNTLTMTQEDEATFNVDNVYFYDRASNVTYVAETNETGVTATVAGNEVTVKVGDGARVEPGTYDITVKALVNGEETGIEKVVTANVGSLLTDFEIAQADENNVIEINENQWFALTVNAANVVPADKVSVASIEELTDTNEVMHANANRIAGDYNGIGTATIRVTAEYVSETTGEAYTFAKDYTVKVKSVLMDVNVKDADDNAATDIELDEDKSADYAIEVLNAAANVNIEVTSSDEAAATVAYDAETRTFKVQGAAPSATDVEIKVKVTPKGGSETDAIVKTFNATVKPVLKTITLDGTTTELDHNESGAIVAIVNDNLDATEEITYTYTEMDSSCRFPASIFSRKLTIDGATGEFIASKTGRACVVVTARDTKGHVATARVNITVNAILGSLTIRNMFFMNMNDRTEELHEKEVRTYTLSHEDRDFRLEGYEVMSSNEEVATVRIMNNVMIVTTYEEIGETEITVVTKNNLGREEVTARMNISVKPTLKTVEVDDVELEVGEEIVLEPVVTTEGIEANFMYFSMNPEVAEVDAEGNVTAIAAGETDIMVIATYDFRIAMAAAHVTVTEPEAEWVEVTPEVAPETPDTGERMMTGVTGAVETTLLNFVATIAILTMAGAVRFAVDRRK